MNKTSDYEFTICIPVYNEEENLPRVEERLRDFLPKSIKKACVLFINDASTDSSLKLIKDICERNHDFFYINMDKNGSVTAAMKAGFGMAESPLVGWIDADLQTDPEDFNKLLAHMNDHALAMGIRTKRQDTFFRRYQSKIANWYRRQMTGDTAKDSVCPLKVIRTEYTRSFPYFTGMHRFLPALVTLQGGSYHQEPVNHHPRVAGKAKFGFRNRVIVGFFDCFALRWMRSRNITNKVKDSNL